MIAVVPILPALFSLAMLVSGLGLSIGALFGISGSSDQKRMLRRFLWKQRYSLLMICGMVGLGYCGVSHVISYRPLAATVASPLVDGDDWPMFRGGPNRTGAVADAPSLLAARRLWTGGYHDRFYASPAVVGNRVYCIGTHENQGRLFCWDDAGNLQWVMQPPRLRATFSSPVVVGDRLICGEGLHTTPDARVFCLDISRPDRLKLVWSFATKGHVECTPVVVNGRVFVAAGDDGIYSLSLDDVIDHTPALLWHTSGTQLLDVETALIADDRHVYAGLGRGGEALVVLEAGTGREISRIQFEFPIYAPPALHGQRLYLGMGDGDFVNPRSERGGAVACIALDTNAVIWKIPTAGTVLGAIAVSEGEVVFGSADGLVRVVSLAGEVTQHWDSGAPILASLAVTPRAICGINSRGRLFLLDRSNPQMVWETALGNAGNFISSPVVAGDRIFVGTEQYGFQCFGSPN